MIFSSYGFLFIFLPLVICAYFIANSLNRKNLAKWILVFGSFFFYWYGAGVFVIGFAASVLWNYAIGVKLGHIHEAGMAGRGRLLLAIGIGGNVAFLGYFKYTDFLIQNINFVANAGIPLQHIILPIGISFFTFQLIAYLVDSFRGQTRNYRFLDYLLFIAFFPQLIVGPIVHHAEMVPQFEAPATQRIDWNNIAIGLFYLSLGLAKKVILADPMTRWAQAGFDNVATMTFFTAWLNSFLYTVSYYFDLSGYADMAIGLGWLFNIRIPENFNSPYKALNFADYWRRWHITLSRFLSDYIFRNVYRSGAGLSALLQCGFRDLPDLWSLARGGMEFRVVGNPQRPVRHGLAFRRAPEVEAPHCASLGRYLPGSVIAAGPLRFHRPERRGNSVFHHGKPRLRRLPEARLRFSPWQLHPWFLWSRCLCHLCLRPDQQATPGTLYHNSPLGPWYRNAPAALHVGHEPAGSLPLLSILSGVIRIPDQCYLLDPEAAVRSGLLSPAPVGPIPPASPP